MAGRGRRVRPIKLHPCSSDWPLYKPVLYVRPRCPMSCPTLTAMRKTSIYLDDEQADRLARLARAEGRPQAEIVREAISGYRPTPKRDRNFAVAGNFERIDTDPRPVSEIPEDELLRGFGE